MMPYEGPPQSQPGRNHVANPHCWADTPIDHDHETAELMIHMHAFLQVFRCRLLRGSPRKLVLGDRGHQDWEACTVATGLHG